MSVPPSVYGDQFLLNPNQNFSQTVMVEKALRLFLFSQTTGKRAPVAELVALKETRAPCPVRLDGQPKTALLLEERVALAAMREKKQKKT